MVKKAELSKRCTEAAKRENTTKTIVSKVTETGQQDRSKGEAGHTKTQTRYTPRPPPTRKVTEDKNTCYRCGSHSHSANDKRCPAFRAKCLFSGIMEHFEKVCHRKQRRPTVKYVAQESETEDGGDGEDDNVLFIEEQVLCIECTRTRNPQCILSIGGVQVTMVVDSGSPYTIVQRKVWDESFVQHIGAHLLPPDIQPVRSQVSPSPWWGTVS